MVTALPMPFLGVIGHVEPPRKGDALSGLEHSLAQGYTGQDVNGHVTKDAHVVGAHYETVGANGFHDPSGKIKKTARVADLTLVECQRLRPDDGGPERIDAITNWLPWCATHGFALMVEWKPDPHTSDGTAKLAWARVGNEAERTGAVVVAATIQAWAPAKLKGSAETAQLAKWEKAAKARMRTARDAGVPTLLLYRRAVSADWLPLLSGIKGGPARKNVAHLGNGVHAVTKFGGSVAPANVGEAKRKVVKLGGKLPPKVKVTTTPPPVVTPGGTVATPPVVAKPPTQPPANAAVHLIAIAKKYIGFREGNNNDNPFAARAGFANHQAWCASFVVAVFKEAGLLSLITTPSPGVDQLAAGFKRAKRWSEYPAIGAVVCYGKPSDLNHTGIVVAYDADTITTVEGNTNLDGGREGTGVFLKKRLRRSTNVIGYGYPRFPEGITSADPAWARGLGPTPLTPPVQDAPAPTAPATVPPAGWQPGIDGVDLSHWQSGSIDFAKAKAAGVRFVYHKATEGTSTSANDKKYSTRRRQASVAGIPFGAYHFARPGRSSGAAQAKYFLKVAAPEPGDLRPCLDLEDNGGLNAAQLQRWVEDFVDVVRQATGKPPVLYTNFALPRDPGCFLWRARYNNDNRQPVPLDAWVRWSIWQFSNGVLGRPNSVPGIGNCDINTLFPGFDLNRLILPKKAA